MKKLIASVSLIGRRSEDDDTAVLKKQFMVFQGLGMSMGGLLWGSLLLGFNYPLPSIIPFGYVVITALNLVLFSFTKNFAVSRNIQTFISLLLPFLLQWWLGGFIVSGGVMLWAILALISSVSYHSTKASLFWLSGFIALTLFSLGYDNYFHERFDMGVSAFVSLVFLVVNIVTVSSIVFGLVLFYAIMNQNNMQRLRETYQKLMESEKHTAELELEQKQKQLEVERAHYEEQIAQARLNMLTRVASEMSHEVQNPLQFVTNFSELNLELLEEQGGYVEQKDMQALNEVRLDLISNSEKIREHGIRISTIVRRLQEQTNKAKAGELTLDEDNPHDFS